MGIAGAAVDRDDPPQEAGSRRVDAALVAAVALVGLVILLGTPTGDYRDADLAGIVLILASAATVWWWRTAPMAALLAASGLVILNAAAGYRVDVAQYPVWLALYSVFARSPRSDRLKAVVVVAAGVAGYALADRGGVDLLVVVGIGMAFTVAVLLGDGTRNRRELVAAQRAVMEHHEREQAAVTERLVLEERARLARELHDSLGHAINVMVMQAGVGRHVFDERPEFARQALEQVESVGRVALGELDGVLRVLRPVDRDGDREPLSPTLAGLHQLCDRIRATGREVVLQLDPVDLAPSTERAAYRIVQEALTNAVRHTASGRISVAVARAGAGVVVRVHNTSPGLPPPVAGRGLINMRERALLEGGRLEYGPVPDGFQVRALLPAREAHPA